MKRLNRRALLRGAGGVALALPFLEAMRPAKVRAQEASAPRRILFVFQANGDETNARFTATGETTFELGEFLSPLEAYRDEILLINKLDRRFYELPDGEHADNHQQGGSSLAPWTSGQGSFPIGGDEGQTIGYVEGPSADHALGDRVLALDEGVAHRHLVYRVGDEYNNIWNLHSHAGPAGEQNPVPPETNPYEAYSRIFTFTPDDEEAQQAVLRKIAKKESALDLVLAEGNSLRAKLGSEDRKKLDQHLEALRGIERALQGGNGSAACVETDLGEQLDPYDDDNHAVMGELFFKISALAFACDLTRVVHFNWSGNTSNRVYRNLGLTEGHHDISHNSDEVAFADIRKIHKHLWEQNIKLYELLKATPDGDATLWDHTLVVHWNELGQGDSHSIDDSLVVLAGGAHDYFQRGRLVDFDNGRSFADLLVNCFHYMGFDDVAAFGDERLSLGGALPNLS